MVELTPGIIVGAIVVFVAIIAVFVVNIRRELK